MNAIRNPTLRKVRNRGFVPVRYQTDGGFYHGWIVKHGREYVHVYVIAFDRVLRLPPSEARFIKAIER